MAVQMKATPAVNIVDVIYGSNGFARKLVETVIQQQADAILEMLIDTQEALISELGRREILEHLASVKAAARDMLVDVVADIERGIEEELTKVIIKPVVTTIQYNPTDGMVDDATVVLDVQFVD